MTYLDSSSSNLPFTVVYSLEEPPQKYTNSVFLAGPTARSTAVASWRPHALRVLRDAGYTGVVFVPESRDGRWHGDWNGQVAWEQHCMNLADRIVFWMPRDMATLPGLTSNDEWGFWKDSGKTVFGAPADAVHVRYQLHYAQQLKVPAADTLERAVMLALEPIGEGALRSGGEREVPLHIWRTPSFQQWYQAQLNVGNRLDHARQVWTFRVGPERQFLFLWALHVDVYIAAENRHKTNEIVLSRPDISTIVMYKRAARLDDSVIVLVREFRSPVSNGAGYVYEVAGGSSFKPGGNPLQLASDEVREETGVAIDACRFVRHESRQLLSTLSAHRAHLFSVALSEQDLDELQKQVGTPQGVLEDTERTYVEITTLGAIRRESNVDWSMLGMILQVLA